MTPRKDERVLSTAATGMLLWTLSLVSPIPMEAQTLPPPSAFRGDSLSSTPLSGIHLPGLSSSPLLPDPYVDPAASLALLDRLRAKNPGDVEYLVATAREASALGTLADIREEASWESTERHMRWAVKRDPSQLVHLYELGKLLVEDRGEREEGPALLEDLAKRVPRHPVDVLYSDRGRRALEMLWWLTRPGGSHWGVSRHRLEGRWAFQAGTPALPGRTVRIVGSRALGRPPRTPPPPPPPAFGPRPGTNAVN